MFQFMIPLLVVGSVFGFDKDKPGTVPAGFEVAMTSGEPAGEWSIVQDGNGKGRVLSYTVKKPHEAFGVAVAKTGSYKDVTASVRIKTVGGVYRAAGLVWRYKDARNYYVVRLKAGDQDKDKNVHAFRVVDGKRESIAGKPAPSIKHNEWQTLKVEHKGGAITVSLGGAVLFSAEDKTLAEGGRVGVWYKDDTAAQFDDLQAAELGK